MYCPKCGKADQEVETFCRRCGTFLPDYENVKVKKITPEEHLKANTFLSLLTGIVSLTLAIILYSIFLGREDTPIIIYVVAGFLIAMFAWQVQTFWRNLLLKKHINKRRDFEIEKKTEENKIDSFEAKPTNELLPEADFEDVVSSSIVENTTKKLKQKVKRSS